MNSAAIENRVQHLERELRRRGIGPEVPPSLELDPERADELLRAATANELDRLDAAARACDGLEQTRILEVLEARVVAPAGGPRAVSALQEAVERERERRGENAMEEVALASELLAWMALDEMTTLADVVKRSLPNRDGFATSVSPRDQRVSRALFERARRRRAFGLGGRPRSDGLRIVKACRRGEGGCECLTSAVDHPEWRSLGRGGVKALARHRHVQGPRVKRASGAVRRRRARERRPVVAPTVPSVVVASEPEPEPEPELVIVGDPAETAEAEVAPVAALPVRRRRMLRIVDSSPLTDAEALGIELRLGRGGGWRT